MGTSAWYAPGAAAAQMVSSILRDEKRILPCCIKLEGQYGLKDVYVGVPVKLGKNGVESVIELDLTADEMALLHESAGHVREVMSAYDKMGLS
jgi:malate dehydrogenase